MFQRLFWDLEASWDNRVFTGMKEHFPRAVVCKQAYVPVIGAGNRLGNGRYKSLRDYDG